MRPLYNVRTRAELLGPEDSRYERNCENRGPGSLGTIFRYKGRILQVTSYNTSGHACGTFIDIENSRSGHVLTWKDWEEAEVLFYAPIDMEYSQWVAIEEGRDVK